MIREHHTRSCVLLPAAWRRKLRRVAGPKRRWILHVECNRVERRVGCALLA